MVRTEEDSSATKSSKSSVQFLILAIGLALRLWLAGSTYSPDAATLAWGSSLLATGSFDPYREVVSRPTSDPIPLNTIRSLSLAQGPLGVLAGAVPLAIADQVGIIELGDDPNGLAFGGAELFAYRLSYLIPDALIVWMIATMASRRRRVTSLALWAGTPLVTYTYGQGLPDMWTIAVLLVGLHLLERFGAQRRVNALGCLAGGLLCAALWTKLLPLALLLPVVVVIWRSADAERRTRQLVTAASCAMPLGILGLAPYFASKYVYANVLVRFEFDMLNKSNAISSTGSAVEAAYLGAMVVIVLTAWLVSVKNPVQVARPWTALTVLIVSAMSGGITHLLVWSLFSILVLSFDWPRVSLVLAAALNALAFWHVLDHQWLFDLFTRGISPTATWSRHFEVLVSSIPGWRVLGTYASSGVVVAILFAAWITFAPLRSRSVRQLRVWSKQPLSDSGALRWACCWMIAAVGAVFLGGVVTAASGTLQGGPGADGSSFIELKPNVPVRVKPNLRGFSDRISIQTATESQPTDDVVEVRVVRGSRVEATSSVKVWDLDAHSDRGPVRLSFSKPVLLDGALIEFERVVTGSAGVQGTAVAAKRGFVALNAGELNGNPSVAFSMSRSGSSNFWASLIRHQLDWRRMLTLFGILSCSAFVFDRLCSRAGGRANGGAKRVVV